MITLVWMFDGKDITKWSFLLLTDASIIVGWLQGGASPKRHPAFARPLNVTVTAPVSFFQ